MAELERSNYAAEYGLRARANRNHRNASYDRSFWTLDRDAMLLETLESTSRPFRLSSSDFVDMLFDLPPRLLNPLLDLPQEEMFKRIFCYWKQLNDQRFPEHRTHQRKSSRRQSRKLSSRKSASVVASSRQSIRHRGHQGSVSRSRQHIAKDAEIAENERHLEEKYSIYTVAGAGDESVDDKGLEAVVNHASEADVVPFESFSDSGLGRAWKWVREKIAARRYRRVTPLSV